MTPSYSEFPMFVPTTDGQIATVLTVPQEEPRGLVILLHGLGSGRSNLNRLWTITGRDLADRGLATVRMDYPAVGDSTGTFHGQLEDPPVEEVETVARFILELLPVPRVAVVGECLGARTAFRLAPRLPQLSSIGVVSASPDGLMSGMGYSRTGRMVKDASKRMRGLRRVARRILPHATVRRHQVLAPDVEQGIRSVETRFLFVGDPVMFEEVRRAIGAIASESGSSARVGEVVILPATGDSIGSWPRRLHPALLEQMVEWIDQVFPRPGPIGLSADPSAAEMVGRG